MIGSYGASNEKRCAGSAAKGLPAGVTLNCGDFVPGSVALRAYAVRAAVRAAGGLRRFAEVNGIPFAECEGIAYVSGPRLDAWAATRETQGKRASAGDDVTSKAIAALTAEVASLSSAVADIRATALAGSEQGGRILFRVSSLENVVRGLEERIGRASEPDAALYYDLTVLGAKHFGGMSAMRLNKVLVEMGFQVAELDEKGHIRHWVLTGAGRRHGYPFQKVVASNGYVTRQVRWAESVVELIRQHLAKAGD